MQVVLIMFRQGGDRRSFTVSRSTTIIGRREDCDLRIPVGDVSRKHCRLVLSADNVRLQDLGSSNGTLVNGQRVADAFLNAGDTVGVGPVHFVVQIDGVPSEDEMAAPSPMAGESALGGTALAADALVAAEAAEGDHGVVEDAGLLEEVPAEEPVGALDELQPDDISSEDAAYAAGIPTADPTASADPDAFTIDEDPAAPAAASAQDVAFDLTTDTDPEVTPAAAADEPGDWDFLIEEPGTSKADVDLGSAHGHPHK